ncbi:hypothetical protein KR044_007895 [Drosophila immigrans]|nr:hypothetical protein KR044_007895 [Drosophila immigrans]
MSKYQKLDSALAPTMHDDDYDESFSLYLDDNREEHGEQQQPQLDETRLSVVGLNRSTHHMPNGHNKYSNYTNNNANNIGNNNLGINSTTRVADAMELDEQTWEVPLLRSSSSNNSCSNLHLEHGPVAGDGAAGQSAAGCRSLQPGFGANLKSKSAQEAKFKILLAISLCCIFMIIEFLGGYMAGSLAIMADAAHLASDCISFVIGLVAIWLGSRPPDSRMSFGYKRFEVMGALASILGIWLLTAMLVVVAFKRIYSQDFVLDINVMMCISAIGIAINIIMMFVLHGSSFMGNNGHGHSHSHSHSHSHHHSHNHNQNHNENHSHSHGYGYGEEHERKTSGCSSEGGHNVVIANGLKAGQHNGPTERNLNLRAAMIHVIGDLVQSIGVFLASVLIKFYPSAKYADPLCTLLFSVIVIMTTVQLFRESISILLDAVPPQLCLKTLQHELASITGVKSVHHLNVWQHTSEFSVLMAHLVVGEHYMLLYYIHT